MSIRNDQTSIFTFINFLSHRKKCLKAFRNAIIVEGIWVRKSKFSLMKIVDEFLDTLTYSDILLRYSKNNCVSIDYPPLKRSWIQHYKLLKHGKKKQ